MHNHTNTLLSMRAIVRNELLTLVREKTFILLLGIFLSMTFFSVFIGWFTRTTIISIYNTSVTYLLQAGITQIPLNPLSGTHSLIIFNNMIIYIMLIGALLAIVIGHRSFMRERKSGVLPLIFSRPTNSNAYVAAKLFGIITALVFVLLFSFMVSAVSALFIPILHLSLFELIRLFAFYALSFLYLALFSIIGFLFAVLMDNESTALFLPIIVWVAMVFILPELILGQNPIALLNPITLAQAVPDQGTFFALMHTLLSPFSVAQFYTQGALTLLKNGGTGLLVPVFTLLAYISVCIVSCLCAVRWYVNTKNTFV